MQQVIGRRSARLNPGRDKVGIARCDDALAFQPLQAGAYRPLRQPGVADQRGHRQERARAVRAGVIRQADEHKFAGAGRLPGPNRPGQGPD